MVVGKMMRAVLEIFDRSGETPLTALEVDLNFKRPKGQSPDVEIRLHTLERAKLIERTDGTPGTPGAVRWRITQNGRQSLQARAIEDSSASSARGSITRGR